MVIRTVWIGLLSGIVGCSPSPVPVDATDVSVDTPVMDALDGSAGDGTFDARRGDGFFDGRFDGAVDDTVRVDATDADAGDGMALDYGRCGMSVRSCLCACGMDIVCQQRCVASDERCAVCLYDAASMCCPAEATAFESCIDRYECVDESCAMKNCATELSAFNRCFARAQGEDATCQAHVRSCLGADYPMVRCPGM